MADLPSTSERNEPTIKLVLCPERWRFYAYQFFWAMVVLSIILTRSIVVSKLKEGPTAYGYPEGSTCGAFDRPEDKTGLNQNVKVEPGQGFDFKTESHLEELFGFSNICTYWDYSPAREYTAMFYPVFEYTIIAYLALDFCVDALSFKQGKISKLFYTVSKIATILNVFLFTMFRLIFVFIAYENPSGHTLGFLCLQIGLVLVAFQNTLFVIFTKQSYLCFGRPVWSPHILGIIYLVCNLIVSGFKIGATIFIIANGHGPQMYMRPSGIGDLAAGQIIDYLWMLFNAIIPSFIALVRFHNEDKISFVISFDSKPLSCVDSDEPAPLTGEADNKDTYEAAAQDDP